MSILITFIKLLAIFDLLVIAVYFGSDILSTVWSKFRKKPIREEPFDFSLDTEAVPLSIDSIRQLYSGDAADFVEETLLPDAAQTMAVLTDREQTAAAACSRWSVSAARCWTTWRPRTLSVTAPSSPSSASASKKKRNAGSAERPGAGAQETAQTEKRVPPPAARIFRGAVRRVPLRRTRSMRK